MKLNRSPLMPILALAIAGLAATSVPVQTSYDPRVTNTEIKTPDTTLLVGLAAAEGLTGGPPPAAQTRYDPGASNTEIKIGNIMPYTGPAAAYGLIGKTIAAYFNKINAEGGIKGRKITFISYDDLYNPAKAIEAAHKLVEDDRVLLVFQSLGTPSNTAIQKYMNASKVPQLFVASGASKWDDPANYPLDHGLATELSDRRPHLRTISAEEPSPRQDRDPLPERRLRQRLCEGLEGLARRSHSGRRRSRATRPPMPTLMRKSRSSRPHSADIFFNVATPKFAAQAIRRAAEIGWKPLQMLNSVSNSVGSVLKPAGFENAQGILAANYMKEPGDPLVEGRSRRTKNGSTSWIAISRRVTRTTRSASMDIVLLRPSSGCSAQCGDQLTRENVMKQAANLKGLRLGMLLPGIVINTSATDFAPIEQMQMMRFSGERWEPFGSVLSGIDPGAVSEGLRAIFRYGTATRETADRLNANTVTMMTGSVRRHLRANRRGSRLGTRRRRQFSPAADRWARIGTGRCRHPVPQGRRPRNRSLRHSRLHREERATPATSRNNSTSSPSSTTRKCTWSPRNRSAALPISMARRSRSAWPTAARS